MALLFFLCFTTTISSSSSSSSSSGSAPCPIYLLRRTTEQPQQKQQELQRLLPQASTLQTELGTTFFNVSEVPLPAAATTDNDDDVCIPTVVQPLFFLPEGKLSVLILPLPQRSCRSWTVERLVSGFEHLSAAHPPGLAVVYAAVYGGDDATMRNISDAADQARLPPPIDLRPLQPPDEDEDEDAAAAARIADAIITDMSEDAEERLYAAG
jgi:hypothetical protein